MRTTIRLNSDILIKAKKLAVQRKTTLTALLDEGLRYVLANAHEKKSSRPYRKFKTVKGLGLREGVSLDHNADVRDLMDGL